MIKPALFRLGCLAAIIVSLLLSGCTYEYTLLVRVIDTFGNPASDNVRVVVMEKAFDEGDLPALVSDPVNSAGELEVNLCCSPNPQVWVYAFVDVNGSSFWDEGERLQAAENPLSLDDDATLIIRFD